jgi:hypothetical protein
MPRWSGRETTDQGVAQKPDSHVLCRSGQWARGIGCFVSSGDDPFWQAVPLARRNGGNEPVALFPDRVEACMLQHVLILRKRIDFGGWRGA